MRIFWNLFKKLAFPGVTILLMAAILLSQLGTLNKQRDKTALSSLEIEQVAKREALRLQLAQQIPDFGFKNLIADFVFLQFLQYFGDDETRKQTDYSLSPEFFEVIFNRDPFFTSTYAYMFTSVSLYAGKPELTIALTDKSLESMSPQFPDKSYLIWRNKAIDELLLLNDPQKAIESFETAAEWADQSSDPEAQQAAQLSRQTAQFVATNPDSRIARSLAWSGILVRAVDERSRQLAIQKIEELGGQVTIENGAVQVFLPAQD